MKIEKRDGSYRIDSALIAEIRDVIAPSYEGTPSILGDELERCSRAYLLRSDDGRLISFFLVEFLPAGALLDVPAVYMGLSATALDHKSNGAVRALYESFTRDAAEFEAMQSGSSGPLFMFATLATPSSYRAIQTLWADVDPSQDGTWTPNRSIDTVRGWLGASPTSNHPHVLRNYATGTMYSATERERIVRLCQRHQFTLLDRYAIDERKGDRLLVTCRLR